MSTIATKIALLVSIGAALAIAAPAVAAAAPYHASAGASCSVDSYSGNTIKAFVPAADRSVTGKAEDAYWSVDLFRYTSTGWQNVDSSQPWLDAVVNGNGFLPINGYNWYFWNPYPYGQPYAWLRFNNLLPGYYAVKEYYRWPDGEIVTQWSTFNGGSSTMCHVA